MRTQAIFRRTLVLFPLAGILLGGTVRADTPPTLTGTHLVSADDVARLRSAGAIVIDTRVAAEYADGHIKGAINVPYREKSAKAADFDATQDEFDLTKLPADKAARLVFYCNGAECWKSFKSSTAAIKAGYKEVNWYRSGFPDWHARGLPSE